MIMKTALVQILIGLKAVFILVCSLIPPDEVHDEVLRTNRTKDSFEIDIIIYRGTIHFFKFLGTRDNGSIGILCTERNRWRH